MSVILFTIGMHTKTCIASLASKPCNWELLDLILVHKRMSIFKLRRFAYNIQRFIERTTLLTLVPIGANG